MKRFIACLSVLALVAAIGCDNKPTAGGPGASGPDTKKPLVGNADDTFTLSPPMTSTSIKQGESKAVTIGIKRGKNFDQDVGLMFEGMPKGVTIDPAGPKIGHGDSDAKINIKAADDAALGDFTIKVMGKPTKGSEGGSEFKLTVNKK